MVWGLLWIGVAVISFQEPDAQAFLDGEEWFFAKGVIGLGFLALLYAILKRFDR